nr:MAG TPA: hypothetical protein [Caudoviricetes sp.]
MALLKAEKVVASLPATLTPSTIYCVRTGEGFDLYVSDATGQIAHKINRPDNAGLTEEKLLQDYLEGKNKVINTV